jgi:hypothetical protein
MPKPNIRLAAAAIAAALAAAAPAQAGVKAAIFPFELIDASLDGQYIGRRADEEARLALATGELRRLAASDAGYEVIDLSGAASEIEKAAPFHNCNGCELDIARRHGAGVAITGSVRKLSNLVLVMQIFVSDVATGNLTRIRRVDMRGNTDETWLHAVRRAVAEGLVGGVNGAAR